MCDYKPIYVETYKCPHSNYGPGKDGEKTFCIFHNDREDKDVEKFYKGFKKLYKSGKHDFRGFILPEGFNFRKLKEETGLLRFVDADFSEARFLCNMNLSGSEFSGEGETDFYGAQFYSEGGTDFRWAQFSGKGGTDFREAKFSGEGGTDFKETKFSGEGGTHFSGAQFSGKGGTSFIRAQFSSEGGTDFSWAKFSGKGGIDFRWAQFSGKVGTDFSGAQFYGKGETLFSKAQFSAEGVTNFGGTQFIGKDGVRFIEVQFNSKKRTNFSGARFSGDGGVDFGGAKFTGRGRTDFSHVKFYRKGVISFSGAEFLNEPTFKRVEFLEVPDFSKTKLAGKPNFNWIEFLRKNDYYISLPSDSLKRVIMEPKKKTRSPSIFLSHSSIDKPFVIDLARRLEKFGVKVWIDEAEIEIGDSLIEKIGNAVVENDYVVAIISHNSINSKWVKKELEIAMTKEIEHKRVIVLPLLIEKIEDKDMPPFLIDKLYADFTSPDKHEKSFSKVLRKLGIKKD